jgi:oligopeptide transport permease C-like protein
MANSQGMAVETVAAQRGVRGATTPYRTRSMLGITLRRLARSYSALWGLCMICGLMVLAALADVIAPPGGASRFMPEWSEAASCPWKMGW